jgi:pyruvate dehydrogenase E2 component (dihydrolipoamide acetyltransferase)
MSKPLKIVVPDIGDFENVPVIEVLVEAGDEVQADQSLITLESDKATMEVPAPVAGVIREVRVSLDDTVSEGDLVAVLEPSAESAATDEDTETAAADEDTGTGAADEGTETAATDEDAATARGEAESESPPEAPAAPARSTEPPSPKATASRAPVPGSVPYASPSIRRFARELGVDLRQVRGSGRGGRILREDVNEFVKTFMSAGPRGSRGGLGFDLPPPPQVDFKRFGEVEVRELSRIQKISGAHLHRNWLSIPHVTQHDLADITAMEGYRKDNEDAARAQGFKLTPLVFLIKATVAALQEFPQFNASLDESRENLVLKKYFNIGIAVDTPQGLVVPVIKDCEKKDLMELARELAELSQAARDGKLKPTDLQGGCFSISSLGGIGGTAFTPIINAPEVAVLGVSRARMTPQWDGKVFQPRLMLPLSLSYDHRVIDGATAARCTRFLAERLEDVQSLHD